MKNPGNLKNHCNSLLSLYVRYDYVQRCEDTVSVELHYIN